MKKTRLIPFDWDKYQSGIKAVWKDTYPTELCYFKTAGDHHSFPLVGVFDSTIFTFDIKGMPSSGAREDKLMLEEEYEEPQEYWINVYKEKNDKYFTTSTYVHTSEIEAHNCSCSEFFIGKLRFTEEDLIK